MAIQIRPLNGSKLLFVSLHFSRVTSSPLVSRERNVMNRKPFGSDEITQMVKGLHRIARNLWWTWNQEAQEIFRELSPRSWRNLYHNPVAVLKEVSDYELRVRLQERRFAAKVQRLIAQFDAYMNEAETWGAKEVPQFLERPIAYFCAEFGFHETLPIAAGGLGVLGADHMKSASDLGIGMVGVSLFYREGYFMQAIDHEGWQTEYYVHLHPENLPIEPVLNPDGEPLIGSVDIALTEVFFRAWRVNVGRNFAILLDTNLEQNEPRFRDLTHRLYGGDSTTRIMQEILLGIGGVRMLRAMGIHPSVFHMNEGHSAFLTFELIREGIAAGKSFEEAMEQTRRQCVFTTHTPVEAGHDYFDGGLFQYALARYEPVLGKPLKEMIKLGRVHPENEKEPFCMTVLALRLSRQANAVSELHGRVSRKMWRALYPEAKSEEEVPIFHITNGVHTLGWLKGTVRQFWRSRLKYQDTANGESRAEAGEPTLLICGFESWEAELRSPEFWRRIQDPSFLTDEELWALRYRLRRELIEFTRRRLLIQSERVTRTSFIEFDQILNPDALTIGFGRRFAVYKRPTLLFHFYDKILALVRDRHRPIQFIFAGKAHPHDEPAKRLLQQIIQMSQHSELRGKLVFIENYDIHVARQMVSGCDVWLNNPRRPLEACGTSGMKAALNTSLNLSIMDGWWREAYNGQNGFAIGDDSHPDNLEEQDRRDAENLYRVLSEEIIPCFYNRDAQGIPRQWIRKIRESLATIVPVFNTDRMVIEYVHRLYAPKS